VRLFVTILEPTPEVAIEAIHALPPDHDGVEVRAERFASLDPEKLRAATAKPLILTYRGGRAPSVEAAIAAGIDLIDVEWHEGVEIVAPDRTILSHHDYEGMRGAKEIMTRMRALGCRETKLAMTPRSFEENELLLSLQPREGSVSVIGMGERGLYSRILAPFRGASLTFVAGGAVAAPSQLTHERALAIYGTERESLRAERVFAVVGNPAGHSLSPVIHNALFREKRVSAAYTIASVESFDEVTAAFLRGEPCGLSVTAPFKEDAFRFALASGAAIGENARAAQSVNTLVNVRGRIVADNTDVDGFAALIPRGARKAAIVGAGGTSRAARIALERAGIPTVVYNRTADKGDAPLEALASFDGDLIVDTLPGGVEVALPHCETYIGAAYGGSSRAVEAQTKIGGLDLLQAQAVRQHELFMKGFE
jgi:3-dehydroquinate dehydratase/shikimate dehydrogenase